MHPRCGSVTGGVCAAAEFLANARTGTQILPRKGVGAAGDDFGKKPIGTGAYSLKDWVPGERVSLSAFPGYFGGAPKIATVDMPLIAEESSGVTALLGGQIDLTSTAPFADIPNLEKNASITVLKQAGLNCRSCRSITARLRLMIRRSVGLARWRSTATPWCAPCCSAKA